MEQRRLGRTDLHVSLIGLGTMTWGRQNTEAEGHAQMDYALDHGVTFWDTAEMYAIPPAAETYGTTETIIGNWFRSRGGRDRVVLATKAIGRSIGGGFGWIRGGNARLDRANLVQAVDDSLRRLRTDYVDLYQLHWPDRANNRFGPLGYVHRPEEDGTPIEETLRALDEIVRSGKVRYVGLSNETPWGVMRFLHLAETAGLPRVVSIQNPYSLLNRTFEVGLAEIALREDVGLLAYSPLGGGTLSGKYLDGRRPAGSRRALDPRTSRYDNPRADAATRAYVEIARRHDLDPAQMALAFVNRQPFVTSNLIGATSLDQLAANVAAANLRLSDEVVQEIEAVHRSNPNPAP